MTGQSGLSLVELLSMTDPDVNRIIDTFVTRFNHVYGIPGTSSLGTGSSTSSLPSRSSPGGPACSMKAG